MKWIWVKKGHNSVKTLSIISKFKLGLYLTMHNYYLKLEQNWCISLKVIDQKPKVPRCGRHWPRRRRHDPCVYAMLRKRNKAWYSCTVLICHSHNILCDEAWKWRKVWERLYYAFYVSLTCDRAQGGDRKQFSIPMTLPFPNMYGMVMWGICIRCQVSPCFPRDLSLSLCTLGSVSCFVLVCWLFPLFFL